MTALLSVEGLAVSYRGPGGSVDAVRGIDLRLDRGERLALIGESGSGKSTIAHAIAGLLPVSATVSGRIAWPSMPEQTVNGRDIGFVFQDPWSTLDPVMTVGEQIAEVVRTHRGVGRPAARRAAVGLLEDVQLPDPEALAGAYPHQLSGGQRQRVGIAAAIAGGPSLLIADEPTSALDTIVQASIMKLLTELSARGKMALLLITHDIALAAATAQRLMVLKNGAVVESGPVNRVLSRPAHDYTKLLIESALSLPEPPVSPSITHVRTL